MGDRYKKDDLTHVARRAGELIAEFASRPNPARAITMAGEPITEQARYEAMVYFHAEALGRALGEMALWLERDNKTTPVAQRRCRGRERTRR